MRATSALKDGLLRVVGEWGARQMYAGDDPVALAAYRLDVLERKAALRRAIVERDRAIDHAFATLSAAIGPIIEVGCGLTPYGGPSVIHTDIYPSPRVDCLASAQDLPFRSASLGGIVGIHAFHHLPEPSAFLCEVSRTLRQGGLLALIEPNFNRFSAAIFRRLHPEQFDAAAGGWEQRITRDNDANQALSWVVFFRDRSRFDAEYPDLELVATEPLESLSFVLTGGYLLRQLAPSFAIDRVRSVAGHGRILGASAVHRLIVVRRR